MAAAKRREAGEPTDGQRLARARAVSREVYELLRRLKEEISFAGLTQAQVAEAVGWSAAKVSRLFASRRATNVRLEEVLSVCHAIGLPSAALFADRPLTATEQLEILLAQRKQPGEHFVRRGLDPGELLSATRELLAAAEKSGQPLSASERGYLEDVVRWCRRCLAIDKQARKRRRMRRHRAPELAEPATKEH